MKFFVSITIFLFSAIISMAFYARIIEQRSATSKMIETAFKIGNLTNQDYTDESAERYLEDKRKENQNVLYNGEPYILPYQNFQNEIEEMIYDDLRVMHLKNNQQSDQVIIYLAGGAYVSQPSIIHYRFIDKLVSELGSDLYMPLYPLAPNYGAADALSRLEAFYIAITDEYPNHEIILMGDSAGGGLALALTMTLRNHHNLIPDKLIMNAPWLDIHLNDPRIKEVQSQDPFLRQHNAVYLGDAWRKDIDASDYRVSPLFGDFEGLPPTMVLIGTYDILYPDTLTFKEKANTAGVDLTFIKGEKMLHVYPLFPFLPEANCAYDAIIQFIKTET